MPFRLPKTATCNDLDFGLQVVASVAVLADVLLAVIEIALAPAHQCSAGCAPLGERIRASRRAPTAHDAHAERMRDVSMQASCLLPRGLAASRTWRPTLPANSLAVLHDTPRAGRVR